MENQSYRGIVEENRSGFRVKTRIYTDPKIFEDELRRIFERAWVYVGYEAEIAHPGDYKTTCIGRQTVIMSRSEDRKIHVLLNACRHRGNAVCREERGTSNFFRCPYHGWVYKNSGELVLVTQQERYPENFHESIGGLVRVPRVGVYRGLIFASLSPEGPSLEDYLGSTKRYIDLWADVSPTGRFRILPPHKFVYSGNWKFQAENGADGYHARYVHESAFKAQENLGGRRVKESAAVRDVGCTRGFENGHCLLERPGMRMKNVGELKNRLLRRHSPERVEEILNVRHILIFPNVYLMDANIRVIQPVSVDETVVYSYFMALEDVPEEINESRFGNLQERLGTTGFIAPDDMEMFASNQTGMQAGMEWIVLSRGMRQEVMQSGGERLGAASDETPQRAIYRGWVEQMDGSNGVE